MIRTSLPILLPPKNIPLVQRLKFTLLVISGMFLAGTSLAQISNVNNSVNPNQAGLLTDMIDTTTRLGRSMLSIYNKFGQIGFSGYIQPEFQWAESKGVPNTFEGGDFGAASNNRFRLRRGRLRTDFTHYTDDGKPSVYFVFQFDGTERGVNIRDFWGRYYENKWELFNFSVGMMARPFGYEVVLSSVYRESPERGRMSQTIMNTERDLGVMFSLNPRKASSKFKWLAVDLGIYNGQGLTGPMEYDSRKDVIARISSKKQTINALGGIKVSGGISSYFGGIENRNARLFTTETRNGQLGMYSDSLESNIGRVVRRQYFGADIQIVIPNKNGQTEFRAEYIGGQQTATASTSTTPGAYALDGNGAIAPLYTRSFNGAYFYFLQYLGSWHHQVLVKYDWYDPNTKVSGQQISKANGFSPADIRYNTLGIGYIHYINQYLKLVLYYSHPINEKTALTGYDKDLKDGVFTCRAQFSF